MRRARLPLLPLLLSCAVGLGASAAARATQLRIGESDFDWTTVEQDRAHFAWSAEVINEAGRDVDVKVTVDLLDDDEGIVYSDSVTTRVANAQTRTVRHEGSLPFDRAADVVRFRFRLEPTPPQGR